MQALATEQASPQLGQRVRHVLTGDVGTVMKIISSTQAIWHQGEVIVTPLDALLITVVWDGPTEPDDWQLDEYYYWAIEI
jgi:hypothetical protein